MLVMDLLATPERWTQEEFAKDDCGEAVDIKDTEATCFCLYGAALHCYQGDDNFHNRDKVIKAMQREAFERNGVHAVGVFNDAPGRTHAEILEFLEAVAKRLGRRF